MTRLGVELLLNGVHLLHELCHLVDQLWHELGIGGIVCHMLENFRGWFIMFRSLEHGLDAIYYLLDNVGRLEL